MILYRDLLIFCLFFYWKRWRVSFYRCEFGDLVPAAIRLVGETCFNTRKAEFLSCVNFIRLSGIF